MTAIVILFLLACAMRLLSLVKSASNEKKLKKVNAVEYGRNNSKVLVGFFNWVKAGGYLLSKIHF